MRPNQQRAKIAIIFLWISAAAGLLLGASDLQQFFLLKSILRGESVNYSAAEISDALQGILAIVSLLAYIGAIITFIMWFRRGYYNLHQVPGIRPQFGEGWAAGAWFVPFLNLGRPYVIMKEMMGDAQIALQREKVIDSQKDRVQLVGWWWALFLTVSVLSNISTRIQLRTEDIGTLANLSLFDFIISLIDVAAAYLAVRMIKTYNELEVQLPEIGAKQMDLTQSELLDA